MHPQAINTLCLAAALSLFSGCSSYAEPAAGQPEIQGVVDAAVRPLMEKYAIPGMAVAVSVDGKNYFYNYGVASKAGGQPVTNATLFEIGSLSKTLTATLATYAQVNGQLSLGDNVSRHLPYLGGSSFDRISLMNLGTHTAGDFPLQLPDEVGNEQQLMDYYKNWKPTRAAGTYRSYSNPGIGLLGVITARSMHVAFPEAMEKTLFPRLGMTHSYINVPPAQMKNYAQGYNKTDAPVRVSPAMLADEAYGVKTNTLDLIRFIDANMGLVKLDPKLQQAIAHTHTGYFKAGEMVQDLVWEQYPDTAPLARLLAGNSNQMIYQGTVVTQLDPALPPQAAVLLNKTGSTGGFGAYALYAPAKKIGIVMLANKNYPNDQRVTAAYRILTGLDASHATRR